MVIWTIIEITSRNQSFPEAITSSFCLTSSNLHLLHCQALGSYFFDSIQFSSVAQSCLTFCNHVDCSTPGLPIRYQLPEFAQTHVHRVGDVLQPSHPLSSPSPPAFSLSQHQGLFQWVSSLHQVAKVLDPSLHSEGSKIVTSLCFIWIIMNKYIKYQVKKKTLYLKKELDLWTTWYMILQEKILHFE